jgi:hypothetical protein
MFHEYASGKRMMGILFLSLLACGCVGGAVMESGRHLDPAAMIRLAHRETDRIVATVRMDLSTVQGHYPLRAALILQRPSYLRLEMLPVIGTPDFFLSATPREMRIWIPSQGEFYVGKPSAENMARFLPWTLPLEDLVMILSGSFPRLDGAGLSYGHSPENEVFSVDMKTAAGPSQTIWMKNGERLVRLIRYGSDGKEEYSVRYEDYAPGLVLAGKIFIQWTDNTMSACVEYSDVNMEKAADLSVFTLPTPDGAKIIHLD